MRRVLLSELDAIGPDGDFNVIVETPSGSRNKFKYNPELDLIQYSKALPLGAVFPYEFGFIPSTLGEDGDPLDVLLFMDEPTYPGVLVMARLVGVIEAEQTEKGKTNRNDRLIAVAATCLEYRLIKGLSDLDPNIVTHIEHFFISYNQMEDKAFKPIGRANGEEANKLVKQGQERFEARKKAPRRNG